MDINDLKEKLVLLSITAVVFLPLRLLVSQYISDHWLGNLGIATLISVSLIVLVRKNKLGRFGHVFKNQITKALWGRSAKLIIAALVFFMIYFGTTVLLIDRGNTIYLDDKEILSQSIASRNLDRTALLSISGPQIHSIIGLAQIQYLEYLFSVSYAILNDTTNGWLVNLHLILFMEQVEVLGLFWFYKRMFKPIPTDAT
ncbi:MAG TPA: hypothetical protein VGA92_04960 [Candidatus Nitrosotenuis sp.]|jgi:hypothetical protein